MRQSGSSTLLAGGVLAVAVLLAGLVADVALVAAARARLTVAADAAALAAAPLTFAHFGGESRPERAAVAAAAENGARLETCRCDIDRSWASRTVVVVVATDVDLLLLPNRSLRASAAAEFRPASLGGSQAGAARGATAISPRRRAARPRGRGTHLLRPGPDTPRWRRPRFQLSRATRC